MGEKEEPGDEEEQDIPKLRAIILKMFIVQKYTRNENEIEALLRGTVKKPTANLMHDEKLFEIKVVKDQLMYIDKTYFFQGILKIMKCSPETWKLDRHINSSTSGGHVVFEFKINEKQFKLSMSMLLWFIPIQIQTIQKLRDYYNEHPNFRAVLRSNDQNSIWMSKYLFTTLSYPLYFISEINVHGDGTYKVWLAGCKKSPLYITKSQLLQNFTTVKLSIELYNPHDQSYKRELVDEYNQLYPDDPIINSVLNPERELSPEW